MSQQTQAASMLAIVGIGLATVKTGRSPLHHAAVAILNIRATWWWARTELWPAVQVAARYYDRRRDEVRKWT
jgi:hypothetical protein